MSQAPSSTEPNQLVEHFFRHESANLKAVLTRAFGVQHLDLVEDKVQDAMIEAMHAWRHGVPENPAGWIHRVARNRILDVLRRARIHERAVTSLGHSEAKTVFMVERWLEKDRLPDSLLRMMFVCCHPALDRRSQIAMTLKILCGFSVAEIAHGLLMSKEATKKRVQRAKKALADLAVRLELPAAADLHDRLAAVHDVLYLLFNEGYSASHGSEPLHEDICEEAARLCHLLCEHDELGTIDSRALLALMLFHAARLEARIDSEGAVVLLEDQNRLQWNPSLIGIADYWLEASKTATPSRYHYEAAIAQLHCRAPSVKATRWDEVVKLYDRLIAIRPSPIYVLNRAIARGQSGDPSTGLAELDSIRNRSEMRHYYLLDCAEARLYELLGERHQARLAYERALGADLAEHEKRLLSKKLSLT